MSKSTVVTPEEKTTIVGDSSRIYISGVNALGPREQAIMEYMWTVGHANVPQIHKYFRSIGQDMAYNTIMTTTTRLAEKGMLNQDRSQITFEYTPTVTREEYSTGLVSRVMEKLVRMDSEAVIRYLAHKGK